MLVAIVLAAATMPAAAARADLRSTSATDARSDLVAKLERYRARLRELLPLRERAQDAAAERLAARRRLASDGLVARIEVETAERQVLDAQRQLLETRALLTESENALAEARLDPEVDADPAPSGAVIRFAGDGSWSGARRASVARFYSERFGHPLPIAADGQTALHERMGFVHHDAIDVAVHPDSPEGRQLMAFLKASAIPFIAFRSAISGSATGAHIHVGRPSARQVAA